MSGPNKLICTLTFEDEGVALQAAIRLKGPVHSRHGRMKLDPNPITPRRHDILVYATGPQHVKTLDNFCMNHDWAGYDGLRDLEPAAV